MQKTLALLAALILASSPALAGDKAEKDSKAKADKIVKEDPQPDHGKDDKGHKGHDH